MPTQIRGFDSRRSLSNVRHVDELQGPRQPPGPGQALSRPGRGEDRAGREEVARDPRPRLSGAKPKHVCSVREGEFVIEPIPGTEGLSDAEKLALKSLPASYGMRKDFPSLLKDPFWQAAVDLLLVEHVMES